MNLVTGKMRVLTGLLVLISVPLLSVADDKNTSTQDRGRQFDLIAASIESFQSAFNRHDAAALAKHFSEHGEYVNDAGVVFEGRSVIEAEFAARFKVLPKATLQLDVVDLRFVGDGLAIEEGTATVLPAPDAPAIISRYIVVHSRQGASWQIASARDLDSQPLTSHDHLLSLSWLVGEWVDESDQGRAYTSFNWSDDGNFLISRFTVMTRDGNEMHGSQRIGWDPQKKQIRSWIFDSEGGFAQGFWTSTEGVWVVQLSGVRPDGSNGSATLHYVPVDEDRFQYRSSNRMVAGELTPDVALTVVRRPPAPQVK